MLNTIKKKNIILSLLVAALFALIVIAVAFSTVSAKAEGNDAGNPSSSDTVDVALELDVNGQDVTVSNDMAGLYDDNNDNSSTVNSIKHNNALHLKTRRIKVDAIAAAYGDKHTEAGITAGEVGNYNIVENSCKNNSKAVSVANDRTDYIVVTANVLTDNGRFSLKIQHNTDTSKLFTVYFGVKVSDTFAMLGDTTKASASDGRFTGIYSNDNSTVKVGEHATDATARTFIEASNYSEISVDLNEWLAGRVLYCKPAVTGSDPVPTEYNKRITMSDKAWTLSSVSNFRITNMDLIAAGVYTKPVFVNPSKGYRIAPQVTFKLNLSTVAIKSYSGIEYKDTPEAERIDKFFNDTHELKIYLETIEGNSASYTLIIPIKIKASNPQLNAISSSKFSLNVSSDYTYDLASDKYFNAEGAEDSKGGMEMGYCSIIVRPTDLMEFPAPASYGELHFIALNVTESNDNFKIEKYDGPDDRPTAYKITALRNGSFDINVSIGYFMTEDQSSSNEQNRQITVTINGFGNYEIHFDPLQGKRPVEMNVLKAEEFTDLLHDGFQMTGARSLNDGQLGVNFASSESILTLTPNIDAIQGTAQAQIEFEFTNTNSQKLRITTNVFDVNINAGSFWARFDDWQGWLIIAGCIIGGLAIIFLIVWLFIHSISKHKQDEAASQAPISSYIVKLNSTIAATQAQQRLAATQALTQASSQMLLSAGPTGTPAPSPDTLQLSTGAPSAPASDIANLSSGEPVAPANEQENEESLYELIAKYITDEELLERIFTEKYEPKGMVRRTFFKSKDLQARELDKEKKRIIDRYKTPMPMDEAIMSEKELEKSEKASQPSQPQEAAPAEIYVIDFGFDPDAPLYDASSEIKDEFAEEKIDLDMPIEQARLNDIEKRNDILQKELAALKERMDKVQSELAKTRSLEEELVAKIDKAEEENAGLIKTIEDLEFKLASAKAKEKDKITRNIKVSEEKMERNNKDIEKWRKELDALRGNIDTINGVMIKLNSVQESKNAENESIAADYAKAKTDFEQYQDRVAQIKARQELEQKIEGLTPMLVAVNSAEHEMNDLKKYIEKLETERESLKSTVATAKSQILGVNDFEVINSLNDKISESNARLSEIEKEITKSTKRNSDLNVEFTSSRRKANEFVETNNVPLEDLIKSEDKVIGDIELNALRTMYEADRETSEKKVAAAQAVYDDLAASSGDVTMVAMEVASGIKAIEEELETTKAELDAINAQMETASDDEKLMLMVDQGDKSDKVEELTEKLKQANIDGAKRKMEVQNEYDEKLDAARAELDEASGEFKAACAKCDTLINSTDPIDLIVSGSGVISRDQKKREAENFKSQLEKTKTEVEQARLAAQLAQQEAEQAKIDAARASEEAKAEAERLAQEAVERAEAARIEAEERAKQQEEAAEVARKEAEEAAEQARREAEESVEQARREAEEAAEQARKEAEEAAEQARKEAEEAAEQAKREAEEAAEAARKESEEAAEEVRRQAEEAARIEAEEAKRKAQEEIEEMRRAAEEEAEARRKEEEAKRQEEEAKRIEQEEREKAENERKEAIARKIAGRKEQIIGYRGRMQEIQSEDDAKNLREQLYNVQLSFDEDERGSSELMDFYNKTMDDIQHAGETAKLKAELAKKPQRVVRKVTERVNRIPKRKPGAKKAGARKPGARPARPAGSRSARPRPSGSRSGARPGARPRPSGSGRPTTRR